jgi:hypothetical protein
MANQEIQVTITHDGRQIQAVRAQQQPAKLPSSWPPQTQQQAAAAADPHPSSWADIRVVMGMLALVAALLLYLIASRINRLYKRQLLKKLRQVPGYAAACDSSQQTDLLSLIDERTASSVFQCFFVAGAASVGFMWPEWDWMVLLVVILQRVLLRLLGFTIAVVAVLGCVLAESLWKLVASKSGVLVWCLRGLKWVSTWVKHGDVAVLVTADSLDCTACPELDDGYRLHSSDSASSSCSSSSTGGGSCSGGSASSTRTRQHRSRKQKANKSSSSSLLSQQQGSKQSPSHAQEPASATAASSTDVAAVPLKAISAAAAAQRNADHKQQRSAKPAAAAAATPSKVASTQTASHMLQHPTSPVSPTAVDARRRTNSNAGNSNGSQDQLVLPCSGIKNSSGAKSRKEKGSAGGLGVAAGSQGAAQSMSRVVTAGSTSTGLGKGCSNLQ